MTSKQRRAQYDKLQREIKALEDRISTLDQEAKRLIVAEVAARFNIATGTVVMVRGRKYIVTDVAAWGGGMPEELDDLRLYGRKLLVGKKARLQECFEKRLWNWTKVN